MKKAVPLILGLVGATTVVAMGVFHLENPQFLTAESSKRHHVIHVTADDRLLGSLRKEDINTHWNGLHKEVDYPFYHLAYQNAFQDSEGNYYDLEFIQHEPHMPSSGSTSSDSTSSEDDDEADLGTYLYFNYTRPEGRPDACEPEAVFFKNENSIFNYCGEGLRAFHVGFRLQKGTTVDTSLCWVKGGYTPATNIDPEIVWGNFSYEETEIYQGKEYDIYHCRFSFGEAEFTWDYKYIYSIHIEFSC